MRRVSYLRATKEDRVQSDSDVDETDQSKLGSESSKQQAGIQKILSVFGKKPDNLPSPSTDTNKLEEFFRSDLALDSLKEGWLEFQFSPDDSKVSNRFGIHFN